MPLTPMDYFELNEIKESNESHSNLFQHIKNEVKGYLAEEVDKIRNGMKADGETLVQEFKKVQAETYNDAQKMKLASVKAENRR